MNRTVLIAIIILVLLVGGGAFYRMANRSKPTPVNQVGTQTEVSPSTGASGVSAQQSMKDLLASGQSQQCTFSDETGNTGTVYVANSKMRGDFNSTVDGKTTASHMIVDQPTAYVWMDGQTDGFKMSLDAVKQPQGSTQSVDIDKKVDYTCTSWSTDASIFTLPAGIEFRDMGAFTVPSGTMQTSGMPATGGTAEQCAACNSLPAASQAQCKAALNCK